MRDSLNERESMEVLKALVSRWEMYDQWFVESGDERWKENCRIIQSAFKKLSGYTMKIITKKIY